MIRSKELHCNNQPPQAGNVFFLAVHVVISEHFGGIHRCFNSCLSRLSAGFPTSAGPLVAEDPPLSNWSIPDVDSFIHLLAFGLISGKTFHSGFCL